MKKLSFIDKLIYIVNTVAALALLFAFILPYISPKSIPFFAILSLFVPFLILVNMLFVVYWLLKLKKQLILSSLILAIGWFFGQSIYKFSGVNNSSEKDLTVMSYNVRMFNHWKWIADDSIALKIKKFVTEKNPDIVVFQEYFKTDDFSINYPYKFIKTATNKTNIGLAIYSKYPIVNKGSLDLKGTSNNIIFADVLKDNDTLRIYNLHLQSLQLNTNKEHFGQESSGKLVERLQINFKKQAEQTKIFLDHEKNWNGKKIIAGDFNNTSYSWIYNQISTDKKDAFIEAGKGFGKTFNYWFPMRIDFILTDNSADITSFKSFSGVENSDHYPILSSISW